MVDEIWSTQTTVPSQLLAGGDFYERVEFYDLY